MPEAGEVKRKGDWGTPRVRNPKPDWLESDLRNQLRSATERDAKRTTKPKSTNTLFAASFAAHGNWYVHTSPG